MQKLQDRKPGKALPRVVIVKKKAVLRRSVDWRMRQPALVSDLLHAWFL